MKTHIIINSIIASGLLFASVALASPQEIDTDLIYGELKSVPSRGAAPERIADDREISTDLIYGGSCVINNVC